MASVPLSHEIRISCSIGNPSLHEFSNQSDMDAALYFTIFILSYEKGLIFVFFHLKCTQMFYRNSRFSEGWTLLVETTVIAEKG